MVFKVGREQVHEFLESTFVVREAHGSSHGTGAPAGAQALPALQLHPRVEAEFPGGLRAGSADEVHAVLTAYRALLAGVASFDVYDVVVSGDKALVVGEQVVRSRVADAAAAAGRALPHWACAAAAAALPAVQHGRVPTVVSLSLGKNDAGNPVVAKMAVTFHLPSALCPHVRLPPWQRRVIKAGGGAALWALRGAGDVASVAEDAWIAAAAAWRAGSSIGGTAIEGAATPALALLRAAAEAAGRVVWARLGEGARQWAEAHSASAGEVQPLVVAG